MSFDGMSFTPAQPNERDITIPRFYVRPVQNAFQSEKQGRPVYDDKEYVEIIVPGNRGTTFDGKVTEEHKKRWPREYAAFKAGQTAPETGTPIEEWAAIPRSQVEELKHFHIRTVEQLADLPDEGLMRVVPLGGHQLRQKARLWLEQAKGGAPLSALQAENDRLRGEVSSLQQTVAELSAAVAKLQPKETVNVGN